jgi:type VI secretion system protein ImpA
MDVTDLLREVSADEPCGPNLEYDAEFGELERVAEIVPERQMGDVVEPAREPEWRDVRRRAEALLARTKDLRVAVYLARAALRVDGLAGLGAGLALIRGLLERYWEQVHPRLDPEDDDDPTLRINSLAPLVDPEIGLRPLREAQLVHAQGIGSFSLRDLDIAAGRLAPPAQMPEPPTPAVVEAAFSAAGVAELDAAATTVRQALQDLNAIAAVLNERVGVERAPNFAPVRELLQRMAHALGQHLDGRQGDTPAEPGDADDPARKGAAPAVTGGPVSSREQAILVLDQVCEYFRRHEPSSPVPLLLERAKRLVDMDFMAAVRDLAPDGLRQVEAIRGPQGEESD